MRCAHPRFARQHGWRRQEGEEAGQENDSDHVAAKLNSSSRSDHEVHLSQSETLPCYLQSEQIVTAAGSGSAGSSVNRLMGRPPDGGTFEERTLPSGST
jgi:hypothetical protein